MRSAGLICVFFISSLIMASPIKVECHPRSVHLGDVITYKLTFQEKVSSIDVDLTWPSTGNLTLISVTDSIKKDFTRTYYLSAFTLDRSWIPTLSVRTNESTYTLKPISIKVRSAFAKNEQKKFLKTLKPQAHMPIHWMAYFFVGLIMTLLVITLAWLYHHFFAKRPNVMTEPDLHLSPYELASKRLDSLEQDNYDTEEDQKRLMFELSHITRQYLEKQFHQPFMEETTYEIGYSLPKIISNELTHEVLSYLRLLDPVKYAKESLSINELKGKIPLLRELLRKLESNHVI